MKIVNWRGPTFKKAAEHFKVEVNEKSWRNLMRD
jgi:hypothetical protein